MVLTRIFQAVAGPRRRDPTVALFRQAARYRDAGRFEEAAELIARGLKLHPDNIVGHLMAGSLHFVFREMDRAKAEFERVLTLDGVHPRALLGLARIAMEEDEHERSAEFLRRALGRYPDFPEAQALLAVVTAAGAVSTPRPAHAAPAIVADRLRVPPESREMLLARADAALLAAQPRGPRSEELASRTAQLYRLAAALLERSGMHALHHAIIEGAAENTYLRSEDDTLLSLTFGRDLEVPAALTHLERVWTNCKAELSGESAG